jgi:cyclic dehypoxanthinyl futalosine synthase
VCIEKCAFCAFYRDVGSADGYMLSFAEIFRKIEETIEIGGAAMGNTQRAR